MPLAYLAASRSSNVLSILGSDGGLVLAGKM